MKKYFVVSFKYSEMTYCSNIATAETIEAVKAHYYKKYSDVFIREATENDIQEAKRKGKPFVECETPKQESNDHPDFFRDFETWANGGTDSKKIIDLYNKGLIILSEALELISKNHIDDIKKAMEYETTASRIYNRDIYEMRNADATPQTIANDIKNEPLSVINYLLDELENIEG